VTDAVTGRAVGPPTTFVGYEKTEVLTAVLWVNPLEDGEFEATLEDTPFYPAGGGQVQDAGWVESEESGARADLVRVDRIGDHDVLRLRGTPLHTNERVRAVVPWPIRFPTMANHTATHLLHRALQDVLGDHARQAGSAVRPDKLRFDFTHPDALTLEQRQEVERIVNQRVFENHPVRAYVTPIDEARKLGAMMLFGEKYGDQVRVVDIEGVSRELCGGTHVRTTAEIGPFVITSEGSVGAGTRRIEAVTSGEAWALLHARSEEADALRGEVERLKKESRKAPKAQAAAEVAADVTTVNGVNVVRAEVDGVGMDELLDISDKLKQQHAPAAVVAGARDDGTANLVLNFDGSLEQRGLNAGAVIKEAAALIGGGGGGRPTMARAGGKQPERLGEALDRAQELISAALS
jgi:alanyl-tRNA synthetase